LAAARKDLDNDHAATAARAWRAMIGDEIWIGCVLCCRRLDVRHWSGHQLPGARDVGLGGLGKRGVAAQIAEHDDDLAAMTFEDMLIALRNDKFS
jgi:hypothetical protein